MRKVKKRVEKDYIARGVFEREIPHFFGWELQTAK